MFMTRRRLKYATYIVLIGCSSVMVLVTQFYQKYNRSSGANDLPHTEISTLRAKLADLRKEYTAVVDNLQQEIKIKPSSSNHYYRLNQLKRSSENMQLEIDVLQQTLRQLTKGQAEQLEDKWTSVEEFTRRRRRVEFVCSLRQVPGRVSSFLYDRHGIIYCVVPKAGCTFWKKTFAAVKRQENVNFSVISSLSREEVHKPHLIKEIFNPSIHTAAFPTRLIVTRDPFSRLLSSYLDKVYLPDFWEKEISVWLQTGANKSFSSSDNDFLRMHFNTMSTIFQNNSLTPEISTSVEKKCGKYMTFAEFVHNGFNHKEPHWMPMHQICNPCAFSATHVSSMNTFSQDARVILSKMNMDSVIDDIDHISQVDEEIRMISRYNFYHFYQNKTIEFYSSCLTHAEIAYRLWNNFRWRGYIDPEVNYTIPSFEDKDRIEEDFMAQVWAARQSGLQNPSKMKKSKIEFRHAAFLSISKSMFIRLVNKYQLDFELFGYTEVRDELFSIYDQN